MRIRLGIVLCVLAFIFSSCKKGHMLDCIKSSGPQVTEIRVSSAFLNLDISSDVDVLLYADTVPFIKVTAGQNLLSGIITELNGNTLYIRNENKCNWVRSFKHTALVEVGMKNPESVTYFGSGNITSADTIRSKTFSFNSWNGSGSARFLMNCEVSYLINNTGRTDIHAAGFSGVSFVNMNDVGILDASSLRTGFTYIRTSGTGNCRIHVEKELGAEIFYHGNIYYSGNPYKIEQTITGSGNLIKAD
ncbi:MAG: hypothetical protein DWQ44_06150 [Bacteroidetes bacterium]|nr:MAG: hypothetical protein DWQ33_13080 [Bacteroidota bacterium]REK03405.1 MAG: hypothetical protein DWQ39_09370 [Bacteroidota bacterium]REK34483.1 MAG: hypothetical protein DWQ44_06150 [Bacteroidota bacterium]REK50399.1 MAG: hypothetical protein DWQ48_03520 [Bacteroidota bacterium]